MTAPWNPVAMLGAALPSASAELQLWFALGSAFVAAVLIGWALLHGASAWAAASSAARRAPGPGDPLLPGWRLVWPAIVLLEGPAGATIGPQRRILLAARLQQAGLDRLFTPARYRAACWLSSITGMLVGGAGVLLASRLAPSIGTASFAPVVSVVSAAAILGALLPMARLRDRAASRRRAILRELPFCLDLITMSVEAGLNLGASLAQAVDRGPPGPMRDELAHLLRDLRAGRPRDEALRALAGRAQLPAISNLVAALATAYKQGASLGPILRAQSEQRRSERFLRAEKLAMEAPVKLLLPLVLFIFPGTFAVLLFPVISRLMAQGVL